MRDDRYGTIPPTQRNPPPRCGPALAAATGPTLPRVGPQRIGIGRSPNVSKASPANLSGMGRNLPAGEFPGVVVGAPRFSPALVPMPELGGASQVVDPPPSGCGDLGAD